MALPDPSGKCYGHVNTADANIARNPRHKVFWLQYWLAMVFAYE